MKQKKLRGKKRRNKNIEKWAMYNHLPDLNVIENYGMDYLKVRIDPWSRLNLTWSSIEKPKGKFRRDILKALINKFHIWDKFLSDKIENYHLTIEIHSENISECEIKVVKLSKGENLSEKYVDKLETNDNIKGFIWQKKPDYSYVDDDDLTSPAGSDPKILAYDRNMRKKIRRYNYQKDEYGNYPIPNGYIYEGIKK